MTFTSGVTAYKTFAFVEVREEVSEAESRNVFDNVKRAFQVKVTDEIAKPERFIVSKHVLRHAATMFVKLKPGEETTHEALYKDELQEIFEDFQYNRVSEENPQIHFDLLACY